MNIRTTARGLVVHQGKVLVTKNRGKYLGDYYTFPGGGQKPFESLSNTVVREIREETGYLVAPIRLAAVCDEVFQAQQAREEFPKYAHKVQFIFTAKLLDPSPVAITAPDSLQLGVEWVPLTKIHTLRLLPSLVQKNFHNMLHGTSPIYLGLEEV